jgi:pimeloyl-ACP methyl ester carboxylesterase
MLVDGDMFLFLVTSAMYDTNSIPRIPGWIASVAEGEQDALVTLADLAMEQIDPRLPFSEGKANAVICYEEHPFNDPLEIERAIATANDVLDSRYFEERVQECDIWDVAAASAIENQPVSSDIPALVIAGAYDPITPVRNADQLATHLSRATVVVNPAGGHGSAPSSPCVLGLVEALFADPTTSLDLSCVDDLAPPEFVSSG